MMRWFGLVLVTVFIASAAQGQDNSPYSRYGIGDMIPNQNIVNRAMGGITAGYSDKLSINFSNPATYGNLSYLSPEYVRNFSRSTIFDIASEIDTRTLKNNTGTGKYTNANPYMSYVQLGVPIKLKKANAKGFFMGAAFGLRPVSRIGYKIFKVERQPGIDSMASFYEGSGALNEANIGWGIRYKGLSLGANAGYRFGNKEYSTQIIFLNDTVNYYESTSSTKSNFGGMVFTGGLQYELILPNKATFRIGGYGTFKKNLNATNTILRQTSTTSSEGDVSRIDSVYEKNSDGSITLPSHWSVGFTYQDSSNNWLFGVDYEKTQWSQYRFNGLTDNVVDNWRIRAGAEYLPAKPNTPLKKYFSHVRYRAGFYYGPNYVNTGVVLNEFAVTFGAAFPLKLRRSYYEQFQSSYLNVGFEMGSRNNKDASLKESFFRISLGLSLSDLWFNRSKYY
ncbi:MAG: hypothetical protein RLY16_1567 [Bacteroidota bacterium]